MEDFALVHGLHALMNPQSNLFQRFKQHHKVRYDEKTDLWSYKVRATDSRSPTTRCTLLPTLLRSFGPSTTIHQRSTPRLLPLACAWASCASRTRRPGRPSRSSPANSRWRTGRSSCSVASAMGPSSMCFGTRFKARSSGRSMGVCRSANVTEFKELWHSMKAPDVVDLATDLENGAYPRPLTDRGSQCDPDGRHGPESDGPPGPRTAWQEGQARNCAAQVQTAKYPLEGRRSKQRLCQA